MFSIGLDKVGVRALFYIISFMINPECKIKVN
jgi:hypothetical protein